MNLHKILPVCPNFVTIISMKFIQEKPKFAEGVIEFDEMTCCALAHAFAENKETVKQLKKIISPDELKKMADILPTTKNMAFLPPEDMKIAYSQIADIELKRLAETGETGFHCGRGHTLEQHKKSLKEVSSKLKPTVN